MLTPLELGRAYFEEVWTKRRREAIREFSAPYAVGHLTFGGTKHTSDVELFQTMLLNACPDLQLKVEQAIEGGEHVAIRWLATGTHTNDAFGIRAKNRPFELRGVTWFRVVSGQIVEAWDCWDQGGLMQKWAE
jgi:predicted ester cyclase